MKFYCNKSVFLDAVLNASRSVSAKSTIPALEGLLITADEQISVCGYDLKTGINCAFDADIADKGAIVINSKILCDITRKLPDDVICFSALDNNIAKIQCGLAEFNIIGISGEEFPKLPEIDAKSSFSIPQKLLKSMIAQSVFAVSDNEAKPVHTGSKFEIESSKIRIISVDGFRLAVRTESLDNIDPSANYSFIVPGNALREIEHILEEKDDLVLIHTDNKFIMFRIGSVTIITRLLEGDFLNYRIAIPDDMSVKYTANVKDFQESIERVSLIVSEKLKNPVKFLFKEDSVVMSCVTALGKSQDECRLEGSCSELEIGFNYKFLLDALKACSDEKISIELKSSLSPCVMKPLEGDSFLYMVLPVRLRSEQ